MELSYSNSEKNSIKKFIEKHFGKIIMTYGEIVKETGMEIVLADKTEDMPFYKLLTVGMGSREMNIPPEYKKYVPSRIELCFYLHESWQIDKLSNEMKYAWPVEILKKLSVFPFENNTFLAHEHTLNNNSHLCDYVDYTAMLMLSAISSRDFIPSYHLGLTKKVSFISIYPIYNDEYIFKRENSSIDLINIIDDEDFPVVKQTRENYGK